MPKKVTLNPTWEAAAQIYVAALECGTEEGKQQARLGLAEMGRKFDALIARVEAEQQDPLAVCQTVESDFPQ